MLTAALFAAVAHAETYALADAGLTLDLPAGWDMTRWSDWDFKGKTPDGGVAIEVWTTDFQVPIEEEVAGRWAKLYADKLDEMRALAPTRDALAVEAVAGRPTARTTMRFTLDKGGPKGAMFVGAFAVEGKTAHVATFAVGPNLPKARAALDTLLARLRVDKAPADLAALGGAAETALGFTATLPAGWRRPLPAEEEAARAPLADVGIGPKDPAACLTAIHPSGNGEADLAVFCGESWKLGIVDDLSFADQGAALKERTFGKAAAKVPDPERIERADRLGFLLAPEINGHDLRIAALPYDRGTVVAWGVGEPGTGEALASMLRATTSGLEFSGPDGGASVHEAGEWIAHLLAYDPFHPAVLAGSALFVGVLAGLGWMVFRRPPPQGVA